METPYLIQGIPATHIEHFWPFAEPYIKRALDHANGEFLPSDLRERCINRDIQLWLVCHEKRVIGAITTEIILYPQQKHCRIITIAGSDFPAWMNVANETLEAWAKEKECKAMEAYIRKSFIPKLADMGYKYSWAVVTKEL